MNGDGWLKMGGACLVLVFEGCGRMAQAVYLSGCDRDISNAAQAIETAHVGSYFEAKRSGQLPKMGIMWRSSGLDNGGHPCD